MVKDRRTGMMFWTPAPAASSSSSSSDASDELSDDEDQGDFLAQMDQNGIIGLEDALDHIGLGDHYGDAGPGNPTTTIPQEPQDPARHLESPRQELHSVSHLVNDSEEQRTDLDTSEDEEFRLEEQKKSPRSSDTVLPVAQDRPSKLYNLDAHAASPLRAHSLPLLISPEEIAASLDIQNEILPEIDFSESLSDFHSSPRSSHHSQDPISNIALKPAAKVKTLSKIPVKVLPTGIRQLSPEDTQLSTTSLHKAGARSFKSSCQTKVSPIRGAGTSRAKSNGAEVPVFRLDMCRPDFSKVCPRVQFPKDGYKPPKSRYPLRSQSLSPEPPLVFKSPADIVKEVLIDPIEEPYPQEDAVFASAALSIVPPEFRSRRQATALMDELQEDNYRLKIKCAEAANTIDRLRLEGKVNLYSDPPKPGLPLHSGLRAQSSRPMTLDIPRAQRAEFTSLSPQPKSPHQRSSSASSPTSTSSSTTEHFADMLYKQAAAFLEQVEAYEGMLKKGKVKTLEQMKALSELIQRLDSLENKYLSAKNEHKLQQKKGKDVGSFDPERTLEHLVFQCELQLDELKAQVQREHQEQNTCQTPPTQQAPPTPPQQTSALIVHSGGQVQQLPASAALSGPQADEARLRNSSSDSEKEEHHTLKLSLPKPHNGNDGKDEPDFTQMYQSVKEHPKPLVRDLNEGPSLIPITNMEDEYEEGRRYSMANTQQMYRSPERKPSLVPSVEPSPPSVRSKHPSTLPTHCLGSRTSEVGQSNSHFPSLMNYNMGQAYSHSLSNRASEVGHYYSHPPSIRNSKVGQSITHPFSQRESEMGQSFSHPASLAKYDVVKAYSYQPSNRTTEVEHPPSHPSSHRTTEVGHHHIHRPSRRESHSSSLSSLKDPSEKKDNKPSRGIQRGLAQDGVISPETDSGFMGSEGSHLTPAAALSPVHQRAPQDGVEPCPVAALSRQMTDGPQVKSQQMKRSRRGERRRTSSASRSKHNTLKQAADRERSLSGLSVQSQTMSEGDQSDHFTESDHSPHSPAPDVHHHDNRHSAPNTGPLNKAVQMLQAELTRLKEKIDIVKVERSHPHTSTPISRCDRHRACHRGSKNTQTYHEQTMDVLSPVELKTQVSNKTSQTENDLNMNPCLQQVSRLTQTSAAELYKPSETDYNRAHFRHSSKRTEEEDNRQIGVPLCPECLSSRRFKGGSFTDKGSNHSSHSQHCLLCGRTESDASRHRSTQTSSSNRADRSTHSAAHCVPVCPPLLLYSYPAPVYMSPSKSEGHSRVHRKERPRRSLSAEGLSSLDESLDRALRAAQSMKKTSRHMAHTLSSGVQYQQTLTHTR